MSTSHPVQYLLTGRRAHMGCHRIYFGINNISYIYIHTYIQGVSRLVDITAGGDFLGLWDQKKFI
jgi:hypothetical protein